MTIDLDNLAERLEDAAERVPAVPAERHVHLELLVRRLERFLDGCVPRPATSVPDAVTPHPTRPLGTLHGAPSA